MDAADGIIFGTPTYMGTASGAFHAFAEATSKRWMTRAWNDKLAAGFTNSGSMSGDKLHTPQYLSLLAARHGILWVSMAAPTRAAKAMARGTSPGLPPRSGVLGPEGHRGLGPGWPIRTTSPWDGSRRMGRRH